MESDEACDSKDAVDTKKLLYQKENSMRTVNAPINAWIEVLDDVEEKIGCIRKTALRLQDDQNSMQKVLEEAYLSINNATEGNLQEETLLYVKQLQTRLNTVHIKVVTSRTPSQEESLKSVQDLVDCLEKLAIKQPTRAYDTCLLYYNSCSDSNTGAVDQNFQNAILGCTVDDQKVFRSHLEQLKEYLGRINHN